MLREPQQRRRGVHKLQANQCRASPAKMGLHFFLFRDVKTKIYKQMFGIAPTRRRAGSKGPTAS